MSVTILDLPMEVWHHILNYVDLLERSVTDDWRSKINYVTKDKNTCNIFEYRIHKVPILMLGHRVDVASNTYIDYMKVHFHSYRCRSDQHFYYDLSKYLVDIEGDYSLAYFIISNYCSDICPNRRELIMTWIAESSSPSFWSYLERNDTIMSSLTKDSNYKMYGWCYNSLDVSKYGCDARSCRDYYNIILGMNPRRPDRDRIIDKISVNYGSDITMRAMMEMHDDFDIDHYLQS